MQVLIESIRSLTSIIVALITVGFPLWYAWKLSKMNPTPTPMQSQQSAQDTAQSASSDKVLRSVVMMKRVPSWAFIMIWVLLFLSVLILASIIFSGKKTLNGNDIMNLSAGTLGVSASFSCFLIFKLADTVCRVIDSRDAVLLKFAHEVKD